MARLARSLGNLTSTEQAIQTTEPTWESVNEIAEYTVLSFVLFLLLMLLLLVGHVCAKLWPRSEEKGQFSRSDNRNTSLRTDLAITLDTNSSVEIIEENSSYYRCTGRTYIVNNTGGQPSKDSSLELEDDYIEHDFRTSDV